MSIPPDEMFKPPHSTLYSSWDDSGIPLTTSDGEKLTKSNTKKLKKEYEKQKKLFESNKK